MHFNCKILYIIKLQHIQRTAWMTENALFLFFPHYFGWLIFSELNNQTAMPTSFYKWNFNEWMNTIWGFTKLPKDFEPDKYASN